ncbi:MAG: flagellar protein [Thermoanaerobacterales bacterium]|jgi:flagellar operon protein|nr:flagellar protein [Thermoanaerobacterales bacterium]
MYGINDFPIQPSGGKKPIQHENKQVVTNKQGFDSVLKQKIEEKRLKVSQHAQVRLKARNINLDDDKMAQLKDGVDKAEQKGVKESLILMNDIAFIVSIKNRTVITAIDGPNIKGNVFTNIDGAVIL